MSTSSAVRSSATGCGSSTPAGSGRPRWAATPWRPLNIPYTFEDKSQRYEGKLTYSANPNHRFDGAYTKVNPDGRQRHVQHRHLDGPAEPLHARAAAEPLHRRLQRRPVAVALRRRPLLGAPFQLHRLRRHVDRPHRRHAAHRQRPRQPALLVADVLRRVRPREARQRGSVREGHLRAVDRRQRIAHHALRLRHLQRQAIRQQPPVGQRLPHPRHDEHHPRQPTSTRAGCPARRPFNGIRSRKGARARTSGPTPSSSTTTGAGPIA